MSCAHDGQRVENSNHGSWHPKQAENTNNGGLIRAQMETGWLSSSPIKVSRSVYGDETEDGKGLSSWSVHTTYSPRESIKQTKESIQSPVSGSSCRIFGFDITIPPKGDGSITPSKPILTPSDVFFHSSIEGQVRSTLSAGGSDLKSDMSKEHGSLLVSPKEIQSKQTTSTRSRTKVHLTDSISLTLTFFVVKVCI